MTDNEFFHLTSEEQEEVYCMYYSAHLSAERVGNHEQMAYYRGILTTMKESWGSPITDVLSWEAKVISSRLNVENIIEEFLPKESSRLH